MTKSTSRWKILVLLLVLASPTISIHGQPTADPTYNLSVRVHVISSSIPSLNATYSDAQVINLIARATEIWLDAGIGWQIEAIEHIALQNEEQVIAGLQGQRPFTRNQLLEALMSKPPESHIWNVYLVKDLTSILGVPGVYVPNIQSLAVSQRDPSGEGDPGRILAHELGHSLTLPHVQCTRRGNLMSPACAGEKRTRLSAEQIETARNQAVLGQPYPGRFTP